MRMTSASTSTPCASMLAWLASASSVAQPTRVSTPTGSPSRGGTIAIVVEAPGGATSTQRSPLPKGVSLRFSKPSFCTEEDDRPILVRDGDNHGSDLTDTGAGGGGVAHVDCTRLVRLQ